jgi:hypothetical protein
MHVTWAPKKPGSRVLVKWVATYPWGPWRLAKPDKRHLQFRRSIKVLSSRPEDKGIVAHY